MPQACAEALQLNCVIQEWYKQGIDPTAFGAKVAAIGGESGDVLSFPGKITCGSVSV